MPRLNVLLITIDTLRADRVGRGLTPAIDGLAARGVRFTNARSVAPLTLPSHTSILTGALPPEHGVRLNGVSLAGRPTVAAAFKDAGYRTGAFVGAYVLDRRFGLGVGFDTYDDRVQRDPTGAARLEAERRGDAVVDAALAWLARQDTRPFFTWIHLYDPHAPYEPPPEFLARARGNAYDGEVAFADAQVARVLDWLRTSGQMDRTVIAIAGDHGEGLGDHGELTHGMLAYDSTLKVPLVIGAPALSAATVSRPVSLAQLAATLLSLAHRPVPSSMTQPSMMQSEGALYSETRYPESAGWHPLTALVDGHWKLIASSENEVYDVAADPQEQHNLAATRVSLVQAMRRHALELSTSARSAVSGVPADAAERLRALGYVSGAAGPVDDAAPNPAKQIAAWNTFERELSRLSDGDAPGALTGLSTLARAYPDSPVFQATYARALKDTGRAPQAVEIYRRLVARWPGDAAMYHDLAVAASAAGMAAEATRAERASLALQPGNAVASNGLGLLLIESGKTADALRAFERAVADDPGNATFWTNLGNARRAAGDPARAEQAYRTALENDPRSADAASGMGVLLVQAHRAPEAVRWFEQALVGAPAFTEARLNLGIAYQESGNRDKAIETYRRVLAEAAAGSKEHRAATELLAAISRQ